MDEKIAKWILEFLLRQPIDEKIINSVLPSLVIADNDYRLKKTLLLWQIKSDTSNGSVSEKLLDLLEIIEELDHREGKAASDSMKQAYCAVAVDCTVRFLEENVEKNAKYFEAVKRVWRNRVCKMESLASEESKRWLGEIEAAVWDSATCGKILTRNTRNEALKAVKLYLTDAWRSLGPTFLELVANKFGSAVEELRGGDGGGGWDDGVVGSANPCRLLFDIEETQKDPSPVRHKHAALKSKRRRGAKISSDADEQHEDESMNKSKSHGGANLLNVDEWNGDESMNMASAAPTPELDRVQGASIPSFVEQNVAVRNNLPDARITAHTMSSTRAVDNTNSKTVEENWTGSDINATFEVDRVQIALKSSSMDVHVAAKDPLPDALQTAQTLFSVIATDNKSSETIAEYHTGPELHDSREFENDTENAEKKDNRTQDAQDKEGQDQRAPRNLPRSLIEPSGTSHTCEWGDAVDKLYEGLAKRRARKPWTAVEEETLRTGVQKFGKGNWKLILYCYRSVFQERTEVDLKDKWRNMTRYP